MGLDFNDLSTYRIFEAIWLEQDKLNSLEWEDETFQITTIKCLSDFHENIGSKPNLFNLSPPIP